MFVIKAGCQKNYDVEEKTIYKTKLAKHKKNIVAAKTAYYSGHIKAASDANKTLFSVRKKIENTS